VIIAAIIRNSVEKAFHSSAIVGGMLIVTGMLLMMTRWIRRGARDQAQMRLIDVIIIGLAQGMAVIPGISRSGITIVTGMVLGLRSDVAAKFSFLLSVPAILGAIVFEGLGRGAIEGGYGIITNGLGCMVSFLTGYLALRAVIGLAQSGRFYMFSYYCVVVGALAIAWYWP
jgi:undecaprenyl-diphosphatase